MMSGKETPLAGETTGAGAYRTVGERSKHQACVDAWLGQRAKGLAPEAVLDLFNQGSAALWTRSRTTLGEITLTAIAERVVLVSVERHPFLAPLVIEQSTGIQAPHTCAAEAGALGRLQAGLRFVLVELLTVMGNLTAEILTGELHAELSSVTIPTRVKPAMAKKRAASSRKSGRRP
jgi:hypothetical protein